MPEAIKIPISFLIINPTPTSCEAEMKATSTLSLIDPGGGLCQCEGTEVSLGVR